MKKLGMVAVLVLAWCLVGWAGGMTVVVTQKPAPMFIDQEVMLEAIVAGQMKDQKKIQQFIKEGDVVITPPGTRCTIMKYLDEGFLIVIVEGLRGGWYAHSSSFTPGVGK